MNGSRQSAGEREAEIMRRFLNHIDVAQKRRGLTVAQLAKRAGMSRRMVTKLRMLQARPSVRSMLQLADAVGSKLTIEATQPPEPGFTHGLGENS